MNTERIAKLCRELRDVDEVDGEPYCVLPLVLAEEIADLLERAAGVPEEVALTQTSQNPGTSLLADAIALDMKCAIDLVEDRIQHEGEVFRQGLRERVARLKSYAVDLEQAQQREKWHEERYLALARSSADRMEDLRARLSRSSRLSEAVTPYLQHKAECDNAHPFIAGVCTCGLEDVLTILRRAEKEQK